MKKTLALMVLLGAMMLGSVGSAQGYFGIYLLGAQYSLSNVAGGDLRLSASIPLFGSGSMLLGGTVDALWTAGKVGDNGSFYYGAGLGLLYVSASTNAPGFGNTSASLFLVNPRGTAGIEWGLGGLGLFIEGNLGLNIGFASGSTAGVSGYNSGASPAFGMRLGMNFR